MRGRITNERRNEIRQASYVLVEKYLEKYGKLADRKMTDELHYRLMALMMWAGKKK